MMCRSEREQSRVSSSASEPGRAGLIAEIGGCTFIYEIVTYAHKPQTSRSLPNFLVRQSGGNAVQTDAVAPLLRPHCPIGDKYRHFSISLSISNPIPACPNIYLIASAASLLLKVSVAVRYFAPRPAFLLFTLSCNCSQKIL